MRSIACNLLMPALAFLSLLLAFSVKLLTRSGLDWTDKFGKRVLGALADLPVRQALIDGELVVEGEAGASDFAALQAALSEGKTDRFAFYAFDLMYANGYDLREAPLTERKAALRDAERRFSDLR